MDDDDIDNSSAGTLLTVALAVFAIVLGGAGLYFGMSANQRLNPMTESMEAGSNSADRLETEISALETRVSELSAQNAELESTLSRMRLYSNQSENAMKQLASGMRENRGEIVKLADRLNELVSSGLPPAPETEPSATSSSRAEVSETPSEPDTDGTGPAGTYTIEAGDTLNRVADKLGVGLQELLDTNPGVDPRRLRIGQVINLPAN